MKNLLQTHSSKKVLRHALAFSAVFISLILSNCTSESIEPKRALPDSTTITSSGVTLVHGRLRFSNYEAFSKVREQLSKANPTAISRWESNQKITSLRTAYLSKRQNAIVLHNEFYFPLFYCAMMNEAGEYQIGNDIFWFHDGYKHLASSEEELLRIKANPSLSKNKFEAGASTPRPDVTAPVKQTFSRSDHDSGDPADERYVYNFNTGNSPNFPSPVQLRYIYRTRVYTEYNNLGGAHFYSVLYLGIDLQEFVPSVQAWLYTGNARFINYDLDMYANVQHTPGCCASEPRNTANNHIVGTEIYSYTTYEVTLGESAVFTSQSSFTTYTREQVKWNYDIYGSINCRTQDTTIPNNQYIVSSGSGTLWP